MIGTDPNSKCKVYVVREHNRRALLRQFGKYCTREDSEKAIARLAPAYDIPAENFTVTEEWV